MGRGHEGQGGAGPPGTGGQHERHATLYEVPARVWTNLKMWVDWGNGPAQFWGLLCSQNFFSGVEGRGMHVSLSIRGKCGNWAKTIAVPSSPDSNPRWNLRGSCPVCRELVLDGVDDSVFRRASTPSVGPTAKEWPLHPARDLLPPWPLTYRRRGMRVRDSRLRPTLICTQHLRCRLCRVVFPAAASVGGWLCS